MTITQQVSPDGNRLTVSVDMSMLELSKMTGELTQQVIKSMGEAITSALDPVKIAEYVTKQVVIEMTKKIVDKLMEENGEDILEDATEAMEDMIKEMQ